jgi:hypothetical protein
LTNDEKIPTTNLAGEAEAKRSVRIVRHAEAREKSERQDGDTVRCVRREATTLRAEAQWLETAEAQRRWQAADLLSV